MTTQSSLILFFAAYSAAMVTAVLVLVARIERAVRDPNYGVE